jgi:hypothetical protein
MKFALFFCTIFFFLHCISFFGTVFRKNCTALSQSELRNFFMYIINGKTDGNSVWHVFCSYSFALLSRVYMPVGFFWKLVYLKMSSLIWPKSNQSFARVTTWKSTETSLVIKPRWLHIFLSFSKFFCLSVRQCGHAYTVYVSSVVVIGDTILKTVVSSIRNEVIVLRYCPWVQYYFWEVNI